MLVKVTSSSFCSPSVSPVSSPEVAPFSSSPGLSGNCEGTSTVGVSVGVGVCSK